MTQSGFYNSPLGTMKITYEENSITEIKFCEHTPSNSAPSSLSDLAAAQILEFLLGKRREFDFPTEPKGTSFQLAVWRALADIPYGETRTYGQIANTIGKPGAARAVGMACNRNPLWIVIPCHRVIGSNHALTGYAGGLDRKQTLLDLERKFR